MWIDDEGKIHYFEYANFSDWVCKTVWENPLADKLKKERNPDQLDLTDADKEFLAACGISI